MRYAIVLHGGAGEIRREMPAAREAAARDGLRAALERGVRVLADGRAALDAVEAVVRALEDDASFNAGRGSVLTRDGRFELEASIMDGATLACGAVVGLTTVRNPVSVARLVMEQTEHVMLAGPGAEHFAEQIGAERVEQSYFHTEHRVEQLRRAIEGGGGAAGRDPEAGAQGPGTVGCAALDAAGRLAAATSTGGLSGKRPGRVGDTPLIGAGTYADARVAVSCTGHGEQLVRHHVAGRIAAMVEHAGRSLDEAADEIVHHRLRPGDGGVIGVDREGRIVTPYNSLGMYRAAADSTGRHEVRTWGD